MISGIVLANVSQTIPVSPEGVVRSLAALVPAAVEGLVAEVVLIAPLDETARAPLQAIADHAGCALICAATEGQGLTAGLGVIRRDAVLALRAGYAPGPGFVSELADLAAGMASGGRRGALLREERRGLARFGLARRRTVALLAQRGALSAFSGGTLEDFARRIRAEARFTCGAIRVG